MSGGKTGLEIPEKALANWPMLESTWEGGPPTDMDPKLCKLRGCSPPDDAEYIRQQCENVWEPDRQSESPQEWFDSPTEWFDPQVDENLACFTG